MAAPPLCPWLIWKRSCQVWGLRDWWGAVGVGRFIPPEHKVPPELCDFSSPNRPTSNTQSLVVVVFWNMWLNVYCLLAGELQPTQRLILKQVGLSLDLLPTKTASCQVTCLSEILFKSGEQTLLGQNSEGILCLLKRGILPKETIRPQCSLCTKLAIMLGVLAPSNFSQK